MRSCKNNGVNTYKRPCNAAHKKNDAFIGKIFIDRVIEPETVGIRLTLFDTWYEIRCTGELGEEFAGGTV